MKNPNDQKPPESPDEEREDLVPPEKNPVTGSDPTQILPTPGSTLFMPSDLDRQENEDLEPQSEPGNRIGRYQIQRILGTGGMGQVLQVHDERLDRIIAAKTLRYTSSADFQQRFTREAQVTGHLEHPNIVPIHDLEIDESGNHFYTMKRVRGVELATVLQRDLASQNASDSAQLLERRLRIFLKACDAMSFAHSQGVIHRDLKPANIMVGEFGEVLVMDWGLAKMNWKRKTAGSGEQKPSEPHEKREEEKCLSSLTPQSILSTREGQILGTIPYMPPEQANGWIDRLDPRSDIYSLGAILYEMLTGSPPYLGKQSKVVLSAVIKGHLEPPSERRPDLSIPWELEQIVLKAMASNPDDRYQRVEHLQNDLEQFLSGHLVAAARYNLIQVLKKWVGRHKTVAASLSAITCLLLALSLGWFFTPGTVQLKISPTGARIQIGDRSWKAPQEALPIQLPAGVYRVRVKAPAHQSETREIVIERGRTKDLSVVLPHDTGTVTVLADPPSTRIEIDSQQFGSRIPSIPFLT
ncbi:MAG: serine/threonine-protein kinase, partial [Planctomycetota bacterium]|nr:serine/threonine-protein kinase [Planctomycetota bacterium]